MHSTFFQWKIESGKLKIVLNISVLYKLIAILQKYDMIKLGWYARTVYNDVKHLTGIV